MTRLAKQIIRNRQRRNVKKQAIALRRKAKAARRWNRKKNGKQRKPERKYPLMMFSRVTMLYEPFRGEKRESIFRTKKRDHSFCRRKHDKQNK